MQSKFGWSGVESLNYGPTWMKARAESTISCVWTLNEKLIQNLIFILIFYLLISLVPYSGPKLWKIPLQYMVKVLHRQHRHHSNRLQLRVSAHKGFSINEKKKSALSKWITFRLDITCCNHVVTRIFLILHSKWPTWNLHIFPKTNKDKDYSYSFVVVLTLEGGGGHIEPYGQETDYHFTREPPRSLKTLDFP